MINESITYDDVLLQPNFSFVRSRKDVSTTQEFCGEKLSLPVISSNMDSVTEFKMVDAMLNNGAQAALHRFCTIEQNINMFDQISISEPHFDYRTPFVSIGVGKQELERAKALYDTGASKFIIDVAHGASIQVVEQYDKLRDLLGYNISIVVGNFDNAASIYTFNDHIRSKFEPDAFKVGIGPGSACTTRIVTGCGGGSISAIQSCASTGFPIIADGGIRSSGDFAKALAAGASVVMIGKMFAGTDESSALLYDYSWGHETLPKGKYKKYKGSASKESYTLQNKEADHRTPEGQSFYVPYVGPVKEVLQQLEAGLRSSMSYVGANNLEDFRKKAQFVRISNNTHKESDAHGK